MKTAVLTFVVLLAASTSVTAAAVIEKPALLLIPEIVAMDDRIPLAVKFRWDEEKPLSLDTWQIGGQLSTFGDIQFFDEKGKEIAMWFPLSIPVAPSGKREVQKGEIVELGLYQMGSVVFPRPGNYYAVAEFSWASSGGAKVRFTTSKKWFRVVERGGKKNET